MEAQSSISSEFNASRIGTEIVVLADCVNDGILVCRSEYESPEVDGEILVKFDPGTMGESAGNLVGRFFKVRITESDEYDLVGDFVAFVD